MTVIVADRRTGEMASDLQATYDGIRYKSRKVQRVGRSLIGAAGHVSAISKFMRWIEKGGKGAKPELDKKETLIAVVLNPAGIFLYEESFEPDEINDDFVAVGSGARPALGALHAGATAKQAIIIAAKVDAHCGGGVEVLSLGGAHVIEED